jgi:histidinol-phosphate phosphatase family protein
MKAVILAGGKGTRMGEFTKEIPKPMLQVGGKPILEHQLNLLRRYGISEVFILVNFLKDSIIKYFGDGKNLGLDISYYEEKEPLGTVGGVKEIEEFLTEDFLILYGDVMIDMHLGRLFDFHFQKKSDCTLVLHPNDHPFDSDLVDVNDNHRVVDFFPKPHTPDTYYKNLVNAGAYVFSPAILSYLEKGKKADFGKDIFPSIYNKVNMFGYNTAEYLKDMGTPGRWNEVEKAWQSGKISRSNYDFKQKAVFLDRDGVINEERGLFNSPDDMVLFDFTADAIKKINASDYKAILVTNQPSIAKNIASLEELKTIHNKMETLLGNAGAKLDEIYFCPHHPQKGFPGERLEYKIDCNCRKPKAGMLLKAAEEFNINLKNSFIIGDTERDVLAGMNAGCYTVGVMTGYGVKKTSALPDFFFPNLKTAAYFIINEPYKDIFETLSKEFSNSKTHPIVVGIGGNARSGKSNLASYLKMKFELEGKNVLKVELDNWLIPEDKRVQNMNVFDKYRLLDMKSDLEKLVRGNSIKTNSYPNHEERESLPLVYNPSRAEIIIIEGVVALSSPHFRNLYRKSIFVSTSAEEHQRRIKEYYLWRNKTEADIEALYQQRKSDEYDIIEKDRKLADLIIEN